MRLDAFCVDQISVVVTSQEQGSGVEHPTFNVCGTNVGAHVPSTNSCWNSGIAETDWSSVGLLEAHSLHVYVKCFSCNCMTSACTYC